MSSTQLSYLQALLDSIVMTLDSNELVNWVVNHVPEPRLENQIVLVYENSEKSRFLQDEILRSFNDKVLPFEKAHRVYAVDRIPRSELGKVKYDQLTRELGTVYK